MTVIIIGRSDYLTKRRLNSLLKLPYPKIAINRYIDSIDYVAFLDKPAQRLANCNARILTLECFNIPNSESFKLGSSDCLYNPVTNELTSYGFTHDFVLSWCIYKGFKRVILAGTADFSSKHSDGSCFNPSPVCVQRSINAIENIYSKRLKFYTLNKNSKLDVARTTIKEIKAWH